MGVVDMNARYVSDSLKIHTGNLGVGDDSISMKFTDRATPTPNTQTIKGLFKDVSLGINPENGLPIIGSIITISFHRLSLTIWDGVADLQRWLVEFVNNAGQNIIAELDGIKPDNGFGDVQVDCKIVSGH